MIAVRVQRWPDRQNAGACTGHEPVNTHTSPSGSHVSVPHLDSQSQTAPHSITKLPYTQDPLSWLRSLVVSDVYTQLLKAQPTLWSEFIFWIAQASALVHMIFGIFELSSLVFISALESVQVFARFALSIVLCQIVVQVELAMIRAELQHQLSTRAADVACIVRDPHGGSGEQIMLSDVTSTVGSTRSHQSNGSLMDSARAVRISTSTSAVVLSN